MPSGVSAALRTPVNHCSARSAAPRAATRPYGDSGCTGTEGAAAPGVQPYNMMGALRIDRADRREEATEEAGDMETAGRKRELAGEVGDLVTSVNRHGARSDALVGRANGHRWCLRRRAAGDHPELQDDERTDTRAGRAYGYFRLIPDKNPENFEKYQESYYLCAVTGRCRAVTALPIVYSFFYT